MLTASADKTVKVWSTTDFTLQHTLAEPQQKWVWDASFSADSQYIFTGERTSPLWVVIKEKTRLYNVTNCAGLERLYLCYT